MTNKAYIMEKYSLTEILKKRQAFIKFKVEGYWSPDPVYISLEQVRSDKWAASINASDTGIEKGFDNLKATQNKAEAMLAAVEEASLMVQTLNHMSRSQ